MNNYSANDIVSLSAGRAFREKIGMYLSADRQEAINLGLRELIVNVQDEFEVFKPLNPFLKITLNSNSREISVEDNMRGIPVGMRDDGINSLTAAFMIPHSGGKHREGAYVSSVGINGEGNKVVNHTAKWLEVQVKRDGNIYYQKFSSTSEGATPDCDVIIKGKTNETGTLITYVPDPEVYGDIFIHYDNLRNMLKEMSYFTRGLKILLIIDGNEEIFYSKNGLIDGLNSEFALSKPFSYFYETDDCKVELALQWVSKKGQIKGYANGLYMKDGGEFITGFKSSLTRTFNSLTKNSFNGDQIRNMLDGFVSVKVKMGQFSNQAKTALANPEARTATSTAITQALKDYALTNESDLKKVCELLARYEKAERAAERERQKVLNTDKEIEKESKKKAVMASKLKDCRIHDENSILYITEGDSALGSFTLSRDSTYVAAMPIRGKIINALKNPIDKVLDNKEVKDIIKACGCGILEKTNPKKLRYGKIAFAADADPDGFSIVCLLLVLFHEIMPQLIDEGKIYWAQFPLYEISIGNKKLFAYDDNELSKILKKYPSAHVDRNKGLGEMDPDAFSEAAFGADARLIQFTRNDISSAREILEILLGTETEKRSEYIFNNVDFSIIDGE